MARIFITGSADGLGRLAAQTLLDHGHEVVVHARNHDRLTAVRDLVLTGRSFNTTKAQQIGLVSQVVAEGEALRVARGTAARLGKFDRTTAAAAKRFVKPIPYDELRQEIEIVCDLYARPAVQAALKKFMESTDAQPYLP